MPGRVAGRYLARHVQHAEPALAQRRAPAAPHPRPAHLPSGETGVAHGFRRRAHLRRGEHAEHRGNHPRGWTRAAPAGPAGRRRRSRGDRRGVAVMTNAAWYLARGTGLVSLVPLTVVVPL